MNEKKYGVNWEMRKIFIYMEKCIDFYFIVISFVAILFNFFFSFHLDVLFVFDVFFFSFKYRVDFFFFLLDLQLHAIFVMFSNPMLFKYVLFSFLYNFIHLILMLFILKNIFVILSPYFVITNIFQNTKKEENCFDFPENGKTKLKSEFGFR